MKTCKYCRNEYQEGDFEVAAVIRGKIYRRLKCKHCKRKRQNERRQQISSWLRDYKKTLSCERCGFSDYRALDFHHRDPNEKEFPVADLVRVGGSLKRLQMEIAKCAVLCANCHRITHFEEAGRGAAW